MARWRRHDRGSADETLAPLRPLWLRAQPDRTDEGPVTVVAGTDDEPRQPASRRPIDDGYPEGPDMEPNMPRMPDFDGDIDDADRPRGPRRMGRWIVATAVVAVLVAIGYGALIGPDDEPGPQTKSDGPLGAAQPGQQDAAAPAPSFDALETTVAPTSRSATAPASPAPSGSSSPGPVVPGATGSPSTPARPAAVTFSAVSGLGCANTDKQNWYTHNQDGNWRSASGGYSGCGGAALALPASGDPGAASDHYVVWWFETGPVTSGSCAVSVYVPSASTASGRPAQYAVLGGRNSSTVSARFTVDQTANRGRWVAVGTFRVAGGAISIHLSNNGPGGSYLGAGQARVSCTAG